MAQTPDCQAPQTTQLRCDLEQVVGNWDAKPHECYRAGNTSGRYVDRVVFQCGASLRDIGLVEADHIKVNHLTAELQAMR